MLVSKNIEGFKIFAWYIAVFLGHPDYIYDPVKAWLSEFANGKQSISYQNNCT